VTVKPPSAYALDLDARIASRVRAKRLVEHELAVLLAKVQQDKLFREFGYAKLADYAEDRHGLAAGRAKGLAQVGQRLPDLPQLAQALANGELDWTKARHVARKANAETEGQWVELARTSTSRDLERAARGSVDGKPPVEKPEELVRWQFQFTEAEAALVHEALHVLRARCGGAEGVEDGALLAMMAQAYLGSLDADEAPSPDRCRFVVVKGSSEPVDPEAEPADPIEREAECDAEVVDLTDGPTRGHVTRTIPPATRRAVFHRDALRCRVPGCTNRLWLDQHHVRHRKDGGGHDESNLVTLCNVHHRMVHEGLLAVEAVASGFRFERPSG
jgi:5-methylcytosine-specific restriction endonuclease McrA